MPDINLKMGIAETVQAPVDPTLSIACMAADAKATGDALAQKASQDEVDGLAELIATKADEMDLDALRPAWPIWNTSPWLFRLSGPPRTKPSRAARFPPSPWPMP